MKKYDKIWVPDKRYGTFEVKDIDLEFPENASQKSNIIVLTVEELRELWEAGRQHLREALKADRTDEPELIVSPNFETYLTSKGVTLTDKPTSNE